MDQNGEDINIFEGIPLDMSAFGGASFAAPGDGMASFQQPSVTFDLMPDTVESLALAGIDVLPDTRKRARSLGRERRLQSLTDPATVAAAARILQSEQAAQAAFEGASLENLPAPLPLRINNANIVDSDKLNAFLQSQGLQSNDLDYIDPNDPALYRRRTRAFDEQVHRRLNSDPSHLTFNVSQLNLQGSLGVPLGIDTNLANAGYNPDFLTSPASSTSPGSQIVPKLDTLSLEDLNKPRKRYLCGRCGQPKVGHVCTAPDTKNVSMQVDIGITKGTKRIDFRSVKVLTVNKHWMPTPSDVKDEEEAFNCDDPRTIPTSITPNPQWDPTRYQPTEAELGLKVDPSSLGEGEGEGEESKPNEGVKEKDTINVKEENGKKACK